MRSTASVLARAARPMRRRFAPKRLALALAGCSLLTLMLDPALAQVLPSGLSVANGQAQVNTVGNRMTVVNSPQAVLNWNSFSIGTNQSVYFQQSSATSQVLNRVVGNDPSQILGSLGSNGRVWLLNPNGVLFGQGARVDVAGLVTSTLRLNDTDWLAGRYAFNASGTDAAIVNRGELRTSFGGTVALIGSDVRNEGLVQAPGGQIILAAGQSVELVDTGAPNLGVRITAPAGAARNLGELSAAGGRIDIHAAAVNQQGIVSADALTTGAGGEVWIKASKSVELGASSRTSADGASGGTVQVASDAGRTTVDGSVSARGTQGTGGQVVLLGREVGLMNGSRVDVSGNAGGGEVLVGGGERGQDTRYANAQAVYFGPQASITADASAQGQGGRIVLWSDQATRAFGSLSARGGALSGDGGFIETSGGWLDARPARVDLRAPKGRMGQWLLDPYDILISNSFTVGVEGGYDADFTANGSPSQILASTLRDALIAGTNVTVSTGGSSGSENGDITVSNANLSVDTASPGNLTLQADRHISISSSSLGSGGSGAMDISLVAGSSGNVTIASSSLFTNGKISVAANQVSIDTSSLTATGKIAIGASSVSLGFFASISSSASGDAIVLSGRNSGPMTAFTNLMSAGLGLSSGRWIVYFSNITSDDFNPGSLVFDYDFKQHGSASCCSSVGEGNGFVFSAPQTATVTATVLGRQYDGTTNAPVLSNASAVGVLGDVGELNEEYSASYADKNVGTGKPVTFDGSDAFVFFDT
ncbi:filamentous hemagglutinin N-terminal domain-containing protein, partial [Aquabacterium sp.]|uniref:two-partner secretion domain-containing protein n=1 Tax=Aquabacterium sp. TaxID=1872578 RepID=UPI002C17674B